MKLTIRRHQNDQNYDETFDIASLKVTTLLSALYEIKAKLDATLTFDAECRSGVCGACAVRVNGRETLACSYRVADGDRIEALAYHPVLRDLRVDKSQAQATLERILPRGETLEAASLVTPEEEARFRIQSDCILCDSCYSVCPVFAVEEGFAGPFALSRALRYAEDPRLGEDSKGSILQKIQEKGIWDCTLCGECTAVCPQGLDPKGDIMQLRSASLRAGYSDPTFAAQSFGGGDFGGGFGFDPNAGF